MSKSLVFEEYIKIAAENGWVVDENAYPSIVEKVKKDIHKTVEEKVQNQPKGPGEMAGDAAKEKAEKLIQKNKQKITTLPETKVETKIPSSGAWVIGVQNVLHRKTPFKIKIDGYWGPRTAHAWNALAGAYKGLISPVNPDGKQMPNSSDIKWVKDAYPNIFAMGLPKGEHKRSIYDKTTGRYQQVEPTYQDRESRGLRADDTDIEAEDKTTTLKRNAEIVKELVALANDLEELGANKVAQVVDKETKRFKKAMDGLYDITGETGKDLIDEAHPGGGVVIAPSKEEGGKIETIVEEQEKNIKKVLKTPTGKYAKYIKELVVLANKFEDEGKIEEAKMIDKTISELHEAAQRPFPSKDLVSGATKSDDRIAPITKNANEEEFKNRFSVELSNLIGFLKSTQEDIEFIDNFYREPIQRLTNLLNQFENLTVQDIYKTIKGQLKVLTTHLGNLINQEGEHTDKAFHRNVLKSAAKLTNDMLTFIKKTIPEKQEEKKEVVQKKIEEKGVLGRAKADYIKQLDELNLLVQKFPYKLSKVLGGDDQLLGMEKWIRHQKYNILEAPEDYEHKFAPELDDAAKLKEYTLNLFKAIKSIGKGAQISFALKKIANALPPFQPINTKSPAAPKAKTTNVRRHKLSFDPKVQKLQQMMMGVDGMPTLKAGRGGKPDDGIWGPSTATVYNALMGKLKSVNPKAKTYSVTPQKPNQNVIDWGFKAAQYLKEKQQMSELDNVMLPVYSTLEIPSSILKNVDTFVNFISQNEDSLPPNVLSKAPAPSLDTDKTVDPWFKGKHLAGIVLKDVTKLLFDASFTQNLIMSTGDSNVINKLKVLVNNLWKGLSPHLQSPSSSGTTTDKKVVTKEEQEKIKLRKLIESPGGFLAFKKINKAEEFAFAFKALPTPEKSVLIGIAENLNADVKLVIYKLGKLVRAMLSWMNSNREVFEARFENFDKIQKELLYYHHKVEEVGRQLKYYDITKSPQKDIYTKVW